MTARLTSRLLARALSVVVATALWSMAAPADAQTAESLLRQGVEARRSGNDEAALDLFVRANAMRPSGVAQAQMGLAEQALGRWVEAHTHLSAALATSDAFVARNRATLEAALETVGGHVGYLELPSPVPGGQVQIDGRDVGTLPLPGPVLVTAGDLVVVVTLEGYHRFRRTVRVAAGTTAREEVRLVPVEPEPAAPPPVAVGAAAATGAVAGATSSPTASSGPPPVSATTPGGSEFAVDDRAVQPDETDSGRGPFLALGITFSALAVTGAVMATSFGIFMAKNDDRLSSETCNGPDPTRVCPETSDAIGANEAGMIASAVVGGVSLVLAIIFFSVYGASSSSAETLACGGGPGELGIGCTAHF